MMGQLANRPPTGGRLIGDDLQFLIGWYWALALLKPNDLTRIEIEAVDAGNLDDVVVRRSGLPDIFCQVKAAVDGTSPLRLDWLTKPTPSGGASILKRFFQFWEEHQDDELRLVTNKSLDGKDPLLSKRDSQGRLADALRRPQRTRAFGDAIAGLLAHLDTDEATLIRFLGQLRIDTDASIAVWRDKVGDCATPSVASDEASLHVGVGWIREQVGRTRPVLEKSDIEAVISRLQLRAKPPAATIAISALREVPSDDALVHLDFRDLFHRSDGSRARVPWGEIASRIGEIGDRCLARGYQNVDIRGACRLPLWFATGCALRETRGFDITTMAHSHEWSSTGGASPATTATILTDQLTDGPGSQLAIAVSIVSDDPTADAVSFLAEDGHTGPLFRIRRLDPETSIDPAQGQPLALAVRNEIRTLCREHRTTNIHLFLMCPAPIALLLGHLWDRLPHTVTYEYVGAGSGYERAVTIEAS